MDLLLRVAQEHGEHAGGTRVHEHRPLDGAQEDVNAERGVEEQGSS